MPPSATSNIINKFADGFKIYYPEGANGWTTPTWNGFITEAYRLPGTQQTTPSTPSAPSSAQETTRVTAVPTKSAVLVNGQTVAFDAYNIKDNNYFKLRDLAFVLSGSADYIDFDADGIKELVLFYLKWSSQLHEWGFTLEVYGENSGHAIQYDLSGIETPPLYYLGDSYDPYMMENNYISPELNKKF